MLNLYGYPFNLAKSYLTAPGTPNSWTYILSTIVWLIEIINYGENLMSGSDDCPSELIKSLELKARHYESFLSGTEMDEVQEKIKDYYQKKAEQIEEKISEVLTLSENNEKELEVLKHTERVADLKKTSEKLQTDISRFELLRNQSKAHLETINEKITKTIEIDKKLKDKLKELDLQEEYVKYELSKQKISKEEIVKMTNEKKQLQIDLRTIEKRFEDNVKNIEKAERQKINVQFELNEAAETLNDRLRKISIVPKDAKMANGIDFSLTLDHSKEVIESEDVNANIRRMTSVDLKNVLKPHLVAIEKLLSSESLTTESEVKRLASYLQELKTRENQEQKEIEDAQREVETLISLNDAEINKFDEEIEKAKTKLLNKKVLAFNSLNNQSAQFGLIEEYKKLVEEQKMSVLEWDKKREEKNNEIMEAIDDFLTERAQIVTSFKQLDETTNKLNVLFPK